MIELLATLAVIGSGIVAGVFFAIAVSVLPTVQTLPAGQYVQLHRRLGEGYHPVMPLVVTVGVLSDVALLFLASGTSRILFAGALVGLAGVQVVSQFGNVPINKKVHALAPEEIGAEGWQDPRQPWRSWHRLRTVCALTALVLNGLAAALLT